MKISVVNFRMINQLKPRSFEELLEIHRDKRVLVVGTTCIGKSTLLSSIPSARDQDEEIFPLLTKEETEYVCQTPWTPDIGETMTRLVKSRLKTVVGQPLFGTVVMDADLIVVLKLSDKKLKERVERRNARFEDAKNMERQIEREVQESGIAWMKWDLESGSVVPPYGS